MKNYRNSLLMMALCFLSITFTYAQVKLPQPSPFMHVKTSIGLTDVEISYSRPSSKGRTIFGDVVPFDKLWRTGANAATKLTFSDDVKVGGLAVPKGSYSLFSIPGKTEWTIILNKNVNASIGNYSEAEDMIRFKVKPVELTRATETMLINVNNIKESSANLEIIWEKTLVAFEIATTIDDRIMESITKSLQVNPADYYNAALYYHEKGKDLEQALSWMNSALSSWEAQGAQPFWVYYRKALLLGDMKKSKEAIETANKSKELAAKAGNDEYVKFNDKLISELNRKK
ncbi:MAG: DUF2911 domain-containing protein [Cyclobacteriaceae bacterium]